MCKTAPHASDLELVTFAFYIFSAKQFFFFFYFCHLTTLTISSGYEMYTTMRADPCLCFLERAGRPDDKAIDAEQHTGDAEMGDE